MDVWCFGKISGKGDSDYTQYSEYLAYKLVLDKEAMTEEEHNQVFDEQGLIHNNTITGQNTFSQMIIFAMNPL